MLLAFGTLYFGLAQAAISFTARPIDSAGFWPAAGLSLGALLMLPRPMWSWILVGIVLADVTGGVLRGDELSSVAWSTAAHVSGPLVAAHLIQHFGTSPDRLVPLRNMFLFLLFGAVVGPIVGATIASTGAVRIGLAFGDAWPPYFVSHALGVLVITPLLLAWRLPFPRRSRRETATLVAGLGTLAVLSLVEWPGLSGRVPPSLVQIFLIWAAARYGVRGSAWAIAFVTVGATVAVALGEAPAWDTMLSSTDPVTSLYLRLAMGSASALVLAALVSGLQDREQVEATLRQQAFHDSLTGLPNRAQLLDRLAEELLLQPPTCSVLLCDLDNFKVANDGLGHLAGDAILVTVGQRFRALVREGDLVARIGGDEFVVLIRGADPTRLQTVAERVLDGMQEPITGDFGETQLSVSIGAVVAQNGDSPHSLLEHADAALYRAKDLGRNCVAWFDDHVQQEVTERLVIVNDFRGALEDGTLRWVFQPQVNLQSGELIAVEALARWHHPNRGEIPPNTFVPIIEMIGGGRLLFTHALDASLRAHRRWLNDLGLAVPVAVNVSAGQLGDLRIVHEVADALSQHEIEPGQLWLEVTESVATKPASSEHLARLRTLGVRLAIDDFGTGWSSMSRLASSSWDLLKVDGEFVARLGHDREAETIVRATVDLAHALSLPVAAEGIESFAQLDRLRRLGCEFGQGYWFSHPLEVERIGEFVEATQARSARMMSPGSA